MRQHSVRRRTRILYLVRRTRTDTGRQMIYALIASILLTLGPFLPEDQGPIEEAFANRVVRVQTTNYDEQIAAVDDWRPLVSEHFPPGAVNTMLCIMYYESRGDPNAKSPISSARGLFQILASLWADSFGVTYEQLYNPTINTTIARTLYDRYGYRPWNPYRVSGKCRGL